MSVELTPPQQLLLRFLEERLDSGEPPPTVREICKRFNYRSTKAAYDLLSALQKKGYVVRDPKSPRGLRLLRRSEGVPLLGRISAGQPRDSEADPAERLELNPQHFGIPDRSKAFALRVAGDSMTGRHLFDGDIVLMESGTEPRDGDIVAALIDNQTTLKTLVRGASAAWLRAENPKYPGLTPTWDLQIQGVARAVIRFLKR
jgi:repressor LexA